MNTQHMTIIRKHVDRYMTTDSCHKHGIGLSVCRICCDPNKPENWQRAKHRANVDTLVGFHRMGQ